MDTSEEQLVKISVRDGYANDTKEIRATITFGCAITVADEAYNDQTKDYIEKELIDKLWDYIHRKATVM